MNLFFRLLLVFIKASLAKNKADLFEPTLIRSRVMLTDQDMFAHMTNSRYFSFSDLAIINYVVRTGCWSKLRKRGWSPVVAAESVTFLRMLRAHQKFSVETRLVGWDERYLCLEHRFVKDAQTTAIVRIAARFASRNKSERVMMKDVTELLGVTRSSPELPEAFERMIADIQSARG